MKASRTNLLCLIALFFACPIALSAADNHAGYYQGTIQCTQINEAYILQRGLDAIAKQPPDPSGASLPAAERARLDKEAKDIAADQQRFANKSYLGQLKLAKITDANPFVMMISGAAGGQLSLETGPASSNYIQLTVGGSWNPAQASWRSDGFEIVRTQGANSYRIAGTYNGSSISGQWYETENGTQVLAGVFSVSRSDGGGAGRSGSSNGSSSSSQSHASANGGEFKGQIFNTAEDNSVTDGNITFTVSGSSVQGTVSGTWTMVSAGMWATVRPAGNYSGTFSGSYNPESGMIEANLSGDVAGSPFSGRLHGSVQGNSAHGTWEATHKWGSWSTTWKASRTSPLIPFAGSSGALGDAVDSQPPGISGVGDVPGPADLPETGTGILLPGLLAAAGIGLKSLLDSAVTPPPLVDYGAVDPGADSSDSSSATALADQSPVLTPQSAPPASDYGPDYTQAIHDGQDATDKYNAMKQ